MDLLNYSTSYLLASMNGGACDITITKLVTYIKAGVVIAKEDKWDIELDLR